MSKYLLSIHYYKDYPEIISTSAKSITEAEDRFMNSLSSMFDLDVPTDWESFCEDAWKNKLYIGEIQSIEEFE